MYRVQRDKPQQPGAGGAEKRPAGSHTQCLGKRQDGRRPYEEPLLSFLHRSARSRACTETPEESLLSKNRIACCKDYCIHYIFSAKSKLRHFWDLPKHALIYSQ